MSDPKPADKPADKPAGGVTPTPQHAPAAQAVPGAATPAGATTGQTAPAKSPREQARERRLSREKELADRLAERLGPIVQRRESFRDQHAITIDRTRALEALEIAKRDFAFEMLADVTAVDYLKLEGHPERFCVVWNLVSLSQEARVRLRAYVPEDDPTVASCSSLWAAADWGEREAYDMFGIEFRGHPNLRRILMPEDYGSFPLRKDYPLRGRGERDNFQVIKRGQREVEA